LGKFIFYAILPHKYFVILWSRKISYLIDYNKNSLAVRRNSITKLLNRANFNFPILLAEIKRDLHTAQVSDGTLNLCTFFLSHYSATHTRNTFTAYYSGMGARGSRK
jgi:hypothetical protein